MQTFTCAELLAATEISGLIACSDGDVVILLSALAERCHGPVGVFLEASEQYRPQIIARDVATLSHLVELTDVVLTSEADAEIVRALLSEDAVTLSNAEATLREAFNRPAPPRPVTVSVVA